MSDTYPVYVQHFEVVLMRKTVTEDNAKQEDFVRVAVQANDQIAAMTHADVTAAAGEEFRPIIATPPGVPTGPEMMARRRAMDETAGHRTTNW